MPLSNGELEVLLCSPSRLRTLTDADLMEALRSGCNDALAVLFERHSALVFGIARRSLADDREVEATVHRVFQDVFRAKDDFDSEHECFDTWLLKFAEPRCGQSLV
jgi:RNA polymerase sigma-70 factor, ECF subfamily